MDLYDDQKVYMAGLIKFINDVDTGRFPKPVHTQ
jgi:hypothetical protein